MQLEEEVICLVQEALAMVDEVGFEPPSMEEQGNVVHGVVRKLFLGMWKALMGWEMVYIWVVAIGFLVCLN